MLNAVIIGIGNPLRGDDAFGWRVLERLPERPGVEFLTCIQLTPELTDLARQAQRVVFVDLDQRLAPGVSRFLFLRPVVARPGAIGHHLDPAELLGLTRAYFGVAPMRAWLAGAGGAQLELGQAMSSMMAPAVERVAAQVERALAFWLRREAPASSVR
jgi:hydrogenase maturation protease